MESHRGGSRSPRRLLRHRSSHCWRGQGANGFSMASLRVWHFHLEDGLPLPVGKQNTYKNFYQTTSNVMLVKDNACFQGSFSTIVADIVWGVSQAAEKPDTDDLLGIDNTPNEDGDPAGLPLDPWVYLDPEFDLSNRTWQKLIQSQLDDLFISPSEPKPNRKHLVHSIVVDPLQGYAIV
jgi:hypothetical protein